MNATTRQIAKQRIETLFNLAKENFSENPGLAQRYIDIARKIAMSARIRLPPQYRHQVCRHCKSFILPGVNCRVRIRQKRESHLVITCLKCGSKMRMPMKKKTKS